MICIHCKNDSKYSERKDGKCGTCSHPFAFEPKTGSPMTDGAFAAALARVSSDGKVRWTKRHLYYEVARRIQKKTVTTTVLFSVIGAGLMVIAFGSGAIIAGVFGVICWIVAGTSVRGHLRRTIKLGPFEFESLFRSWVRAHGEPAALIVRKAAPLPAASRPLPTDIAEYSFDRAVICDSADTVDLLLANNFHFENNCAVLSVDGYPEAAFETVRAMLKKNPKLVVYALHDATLDGCALARRLATSPEWFQKGASIIDVGLRPRHAQPFKGYWTATGMTAGLLASEEDKWLARYSLELAVIRPEQVIKRLFRALSNTPDAFTEGLVADAAAFGSDATASDGGGDSFG